MRKPENVTEFCSAVDSIGNLSEVEMFFAWAKDLEIGKSKMGLLAMDRLYLRQAELEQQQKAALLLSDKRQADQSYQNSAQLLGNPPVGADAPPSPAALERSESHAHRMGDMQDFARELSVPIPQAAEIIADTHNQEQPAADPARARKQTTRSSVTVGHDTTREQAEAQLRTEQEQRQRQREEQQQGQTPVNPKTSNPPKK